MGLIFLGVIALLAPSDFATAVAVMIPIIIMIGAFFYARVTLFILAIFATLMRLNLESLIERQIEIPYYEQVMVIANAADALMILALMLSMLQGYLYPKSVPSCYRLLFCRCKIDE